MIRNIYGLIKIFYFNLKHKLKKNFFITQAHFGVLRMLISAKRRLGLPSNSGRLVSPLRRLIASGGYLPHLTAEFALKLGRPISSSKIGTANIKL